MTTEHDQVLVPILQKAVAAIRHAPDWETAKQASAPNGRPIIHWLLSQARCAVPFDQDIACRTRAGELFALIGELDGYVRGFLGLIETDLSALESGPVDAKSITDLDAALQHTAAVAGFIAHRHFGGLAPLLVATGKRHAVAADRLEAIRSRPDATDAPRPDAPSLIPNAEREADALLTLAIASHRLAIVRQAMEDGPLVTTMAPVAPGVN